MRIVVGAYLINRYFASPRGASGAYITGVVQRVWDTSAHTFAIIKDDRGVQRIVCL